MHNHTQTVVRMSGIIAVIHKRVYDYNAADRSDMIRMHERTTRK